MMHKYNSHMYRQAHTSLLSARSLCELIEDMKISFILDLPDDPALFQQIVRDLGTDGFTMCIKHDFQVFSLVDR